MNDSIAIGDTVAYSALFLRSIGVVSGPMPFARGVVIELIPLGESTVLAEVNWTNDYVGEIPTRVNVKNLARVGLNSRFSNI